MTDKLTRFIHDHKPIAAVAVVYAIMSAMLLLEFLVSVFGLSILGVEDWTKIIREWFPWTCLSIVPLLWFGKWSRYVYVPLILIWFVLAAILWFARIKFKLALDGSIVGMVMTSSLSEIKWFIRDSLNGVVLVIGSIVALFMFMMLKLCSVARCFRVSRWSVATGIVILIGWGCTVRIHNSWVEAFGRLASIHLVMDSFSNYRGFRQMADVAENPHIPFSARLADDENVVGVVVIGESATRNHWGLYGYERDTTPCMSAIKDDLIIFEDVVTPAGQTSEALPLLFTTRTIGEMDCRYTMSQVLKQVGYDVAFCSSQEKWDRFHGVPALIFSGCDPMEFLANLDDHSGYDDLLVSWLSSTLHNSSKRRIVFLQMIGSHAPSELRYPLDGAKFEIGSFSGCAAGPACKINHYDNSVVYTDGVLKRIIDILDDHDGGGASWMIYIADHGESPDSAEWRDMSDRNVWDVPFIVWMSDSYKRRHSDMVMQMKKCVKRKLQSDQLFYGLLRFMGVDGLGVGNDMNFLSDEFEERVPRMINNGKSMYGWEN